MGEEGKEEREALLLAENIYRNQTWVNSKKETLV